jgi:hypothetical protein
VYVRSKTIKGHTYYYLVEGRRDGKRVSQKVIRYLGKHGWASLQPTRFIPVIRKDYKEVFTRLFNRLGYSVAYDIPFADSTQFGSTTRSTKTVQFRDPVSGLTMAHELGHVIDIHLGATPDPPRPMFSGSPDFLEFLPELQRVVDYLNESMSLVSKHNLANLQRWNHEHPDNSVIRSIVLDRITTYHNYHATYAYQYYELFADLVSLCFIQPRKARQLAPNASQWLMQKLYNNPLLRKELTEADIWELGTTQDTATD